jgi:methionyl-tRNA formyltransferase
MKLVFLGTPEFAVPSLEALASNGHNVLAVYTQPDRARGRGGKPAMPPVKAAAIHLGIPVHQPERIRRPEVVAELAGLHAELMVVVGYGQMIPRSILDLPPHGIINVHASLLPKYRGAAPIQWAIANGETVTGVTTMRIDEGLDTGAILLQAEMPIGETETAAELSPRLAALGAGLLIETLRRLESGTLIPEPQEAAQATYAPILKKEDGLIDWSLPAVKISNRIRGFQPWPGAYTFFRGHRFHIWKGRPSTQPVLQSHLVWTGHHLLAGCGAGTSLELEEVQLEGRKRMPAAAFAHGHRLSENEMLGS